MAIAGRCRDRSLLVELRNLSYKAIRNRIDALVAEGRLVAIQPMFRGDQAQRHMFASDQVVAFLDDADTDRRGRRIRSAARATLDSFIAGAAIGVRWDPKDRNGLAIMARIAPLSDKVWDIRCIDPRPGARIFGRFSEPDVFVALTWAERQQCDFASEALRCRETWATMFADLPPFEGGSVNDYITANARVVASGTRRRRSYR